MTRACALLLLASGGCSLVSYRPVPRVSDPRRPITCREDRTPALVDLSAGAAMLWYTLEKPSLDLRFCDRNEQCLPRQRWSFALGAALLASGLVGNSAKDRCARAKVQRLRCADGDDEACIELDPDWWPSLRPTEPSTSAAP